MFNKVYEDIEKSIPQPTLRKMILGAAPFAVVSLIAGAVLAGRYIRYRRDRRRKLKLRKFAAKNGKDPQGNKLDKEERDILIPPALPRTFSPSKRKGVVRNVLRSLFGVNRVKDREKRVNEARNRSVVVIEDDGRRDEEQGHTTLLIESSPFSSHYSPSSSGSQSFSPTSLPPSPPSASYPSPSSNASISSHSTYNSLVGSSNQSKNRNTVILSEVATTTQSYSPIRSGINNTGSPHNTHRRAASMI